MTIYKGIASALGIGLCGLLIGCGSPSETNSPIHRADSVLTSTPQPESVVPTNRSDTLLKHLFDKAQIPKTATWEGDLVDGAHWQDRNGDNWLLISQVFEGEISDKSLVAKYFATCYNDVSGEMAPYWAIKEVNQDYFSVPHRTENTLEISDLDHDGIAESLFLYEVEPDGSAPTIVKLMLHVKGKKYAVRGQLAGMDYDRGKVEERKFDPAFKEIDPMFRDYAREKWDAFERKYYKGWPEVVD